MRYIDKKFLLIFMLLGLNLEAQESDCVCGNGIQEILPQSVSSCPYRLYGAAISSPTSQATLYYLNTYDGVGHSIAPIVGSFGGNSLVGITSMDFSPTGVLYAVGKIANTSNWALATVNCNDGQATVLGTFNPGTGSGITAINFDSQGRLYAHRTSKTGQIRSDGMLATLNRSTGALVEIGFTGLGQVGNGIAFAPFPDNFLYHSGATQPESDPTDWRSLSILDLETGHAGIATSATIPDPANNNPRINDMDFDPLTKTMFVAINNKAYGANSPNVNYLGTIDLVSANVSFLKQPVKKAPAGLSAIAVNRPYETCDQGMPPPLGELALPVGTACSTSCSLVEDNCSDGIDNDFDGLVDCADSNCANLNCNSSSCVLFLCVNNTCQDQGQAVNCNDSNDCTDDTCDLGQCNNVVDNTNLCADSNPCTVEQCISGVCEYSHDNVNGTPCDDEIFCTSEDACDGGFCLGTPVTDGTPCDDGITCTDPDTCVVGECIGGRITEDCTNGINDNCDMCIDGVSGPDCPGDDEGCGISTGQEGECYDGIDNDLDNLIDCGDPDCNGLDCADDNNPCTNDVCQFLSCTHPENDDGFCSDDNPCTDDFCSGGSCLGTPNIAPCDDGDNCSEEDVCGSGICQPGPTKSCDDENPCTADACYKGDCSFISLPNNSPCTADANQCTDDYCSSSKCIHPNDNTNTCSDGLACTVADACAAGVCSGTHGVEDCSNGLDDDCDFLVDRDDPNCQHLWLRVFITSETFVPDFGGVIEADALCQNAAINASPARTGIFKAFISSSTSDAATRITNPNNKPWYLYSSTAAKIADNKVDLLDGTIIQEINVDENGVNIDNPKFTWTGSKSDGTVYTDSNGIPNTCSDWTSTQANKQGTRGASDKINYQWVNQVEASCNQDFRLYCFQVE